MSPPFFFLPFLKIADNQPWSYRSIVHFVVTVVGNVIIFVSIVVVIVIITSFCVSMLRNLADLIEFFPLIRFS